MNIQSLIDKLFRRDPKMKPNLCYSQNGEDLILNRLLENKEKGFFIDVGAHHPIRFSNTYLFYKKGWSGINIDAMPGSMIKFNKIRPKDINIECGVGLKNDQLTFYQFNETALNTFSKKEALSKNKDGYKIIKSNFLQVESLENLLDKYMPRNTKIDFLNIDVEGMDLKILSQLIPNKLHPQLISVETHNVDGSKSNECDKIHELLKNSNYKLYKRIGPTTLYTI